MGQIDAWKITARNSEGYRPRRVRVGGCEAGLGVRGTRNQVVPNPGGPHEFCPLATEPLGGIFARSPGQRGVSPQMTTASDPHTRGRLFGEEGGCPRAPEVLRDLVPACRVEWRSPSRRTVR